MIAITIDGVEKQLRNELNEITLPEFEQICEITQREIDYIDRHSEIFKIIGLTYDDLEVIDASDFIQLCKDYNKTFADSTLFVKDIEIDGKTYTSYTKDKFILSVRDLGKIEKYIKAKPLGFLGEMLAIIYKDNSVPNSLWYTDDYIKLKAELFRNNLKADIAIPYLSLIYNDLFKKLVE